MAESIRTVLYYAAVGLNFLLCPLCVFVLLGACTSFCRRTVNRLLSDTFGFNAVRMTAFIGTPVHELGHVLMCLIFGHKVERVRWFPDRKSSAALGSVAHTYNRKSFYQKLGLVFISIGPMFSGLGFIMLVMCFCFPEALSACLAAAKGATSGGASAVAECVKAFFVGAFGGSTATWVRVIGALLICFVCLHLELSRADIKNGLAGLPCYAVIALSAALVAALADIWIYNGVLGAVLGFINSATVFILALFVPCLCFSLSLVLLAFLLRCIAYIFGKR